MADDPVGHRACLDLTGETNHAWNAIGPLPACVFLRRERCHPGIRPSVHVRTIIGAILHECIVRDSKLIEEVQGMNLSYGMTLRPSGLQSMIRRRANVMIRKAFKENGIEFATPSVQVGGDERQGAAAAVAATRLQHEKTVTQSA